MNIAKDVGASQDLETQSLLALLEEQERIKANQISGVQTILVVFATKAMVFDRESLRQKIALTYPNAKVFFQTTDGTALGEVSPKSVDLLIDFTAPGTHGSWFRAKKLRAMARVAVGRNALLFRKGKYDRIIDEKSGELIHGRELPKDVLDRERFVQREVLALAGIPLAQVGTTLPDHGQSIALKLPRLKKA